MSAAAVKDLLVKQDLLSEYNIKPWWEKVRGYFLAAAGISATWLFYLGATKGHINCLPEESDNTTMEISSVQLRFANSYCIDQIPWRHSIIGFTSLVAVVVIFLTYEWWFSVPDVISAFENFSQVERAFPSISRRELDEVSKESIIMHPLPNNAYLQRQVDEYRGCISRLWTYKGRVWMYYYLRCIIATSFTLVVLSLVGSWLDGDFAATSFFCHILETDMEALTYSMAGFENFVCTSQISRQVFPHVCIFLVCILAQMIFTIAGCCVIFWSMYKREIVCGRDSRRFTKNFSNFRSFANFMHVCLENSSNSGNSDFLLLVRCLLSPRLIDVMTCNVEQMNGADFDYDYVDLYTLVDKNAGKEVIRVLSDKRISSENDSAFTGHMLHRIKFDRWDQASKNFAELLAEGRKWELLVKLLNAKMESSATSDDGCGLQTLNYDLLELNAKGITTGKSILYYALCYSIETQDIWNVTQVMKTKKQFSTSAARVLLSHCPTKELYVHYDGRSDSIEGFVRKEMNRDVNYPTDLKNELLALITSQRSNLIPSANLNPSYLQQLNAEYDNINTLESDREKKVRWTKIATDISGIKLTYWDDSTKHFARSLAEHRHWEIFVALLNAKTVIGDHESDLILGQDCGVTNLNPQDFDHNGKSVYHYAFSCPRYPAQPFVFTAARHILWAKRGVKQLLHSSSQREAEDLVEAVRREFRSKQKILKELLKLIEKSENWVEPEEKNDSSSFMLPDDNEQIHNSNEDDTLLEVDTRC